MDVGDDPEEVEMLKDIGNSLWSGHDDFYKFKTSNDPFRPWMAINFSKTLCGCRWCSRLLSIDPSEFGEKIGKSGALGSLIIFIYNYMKFERNVFLQKYFYNLNRVNDSGTMKKH